MILLYNIIPALLGLVLAACIYRGRWRTAACVCAVMLLYFVAQPSYMPKSTFSREALPAFEKSHAGIEDRGIRPMSNEERDERLKSAIREGLPFIDK